eukprot:8055013-Pyramimonas_sp.AAC.1
MRALQNLHPPRSLPPLLRHRHSPPPPPRPRPPALVFLLPLLIPSSGSHGGPRAARLTSHAGRVEQRTTQPAQSLPNSSP